MKTTAICYYSQHHGNTKKLLDAIRKSDPEVVLIDVTNDVMKDGPADLEEYDRIGFASGIYLSKFHQTILKFAAENLLGEKEVFLICTYGGSANYKSIENILKEKRAKVIGKFGCKGYDTFGPFKLVGGIAKGHPDEKDLEAAVNFVTGLQS